MLRAAGGRATSPAWMYRRAASASYNATLSSAVRASRGRQSSKRYDATTYLVPQWSLRADHDVLLLVEGGGMIDPITAEIRQCRARVCQDEEMGIALRSSADPPNIKETPRPFVRAIDRDGRSISHKRSTFPFTWGSLPRGLKRMLEIVERVVCGASTRVRCGLPPIPASRARISTTSRCCPDLRSRAVGGICRE